jgi:hypothetical protein
VEERRGLRLFGFRIGALRVLFAVSSFYLEMGNVGNGGQGWPTELSDECCGKKLTLVLYIQ